MSCLSFKGNATNLLETRPEVTDNKSAELLAEQLELLRHDVASDVYNTFLGFTSCSDEGDRVECSIAQLAHLDAWNSTVVICLLERKKLEGHRQKRYADTYAFYVTAVIRLLVGRVGFF